MSSHLRPGVGHIEQLEIDMQPRCDDGTLPPVCLWRDWYRYLVDAHQRMGRPIATDHATRQKHLLEAGFVDVQHQVIKIPIGEWIPGQWEIGRWMRVGITDSLEPLSLAAFTRPAYSWPVSHVIRYCGEVATKVNKASIHAYHEM